MAHQQVLARVATFNRISPDVRREHGITALTLAKNGFYYSAKSAQILCFLCHYILTVSDIRNLNHTPEQCLRYRENRARNAGDTVDCRHAMDFNNVKACGAGALTQNAMTSQHMAAAASSARSGRPTAACKTDVVDGRPTAACRTDVVDGRPTAACRTDVVDGRPTAACRTDVVDGRPTAACGTDVVDGRPTAACSMDVVEGVIPSNRSARSRGTDTVDGLHPRYQQEPVAMDGVDEVDHSPTFQTRTQTMETVVAANGFHANHSRTQVTEPTMQAVRPVSRLEMPSEEMETDGPSSSDDYREVNLDKMLQIQLKAPWMGDVRKMGFSEEAIRSVALEQLHEHQVLFSGPHACVNALIAYEAEEEEHILGKWDPSTLKSNQDKSKQHHKKKRLHRKQRKESQRLPKLEKPEVISPSIQALMDEKEDVEDDLLCKLCVDDEATTVFLPCGHFCCCATCAASQFNCPVCRSTVVSTIRVNTDISGKLTE